MAHMTEITCICGCKRKKMVRTADVKRGWGKYFSKSCKATSQERRTGQHRQYIYRKEFGGTPQFDQQGRYKGFTDGAFDNTSCQDNED